MRCVWGRPFDQCQGCWDVDDGLPLPSPPPSKASQLSQLQASGWTSIHRRQSANPLLCVDSAQGPVMQPTALLCMAEVIRGLRSRPHFSDSSGWPDCVPSSHSLTVMCCTTLILFSNWFLVRDALSFLYLGSFYFFLDRVTTDDFSF